MCCAADIRRKQNFLDHNPLSEVLSIHLWILFFWIYPRQNALDQVYFIWLVRLAGKIFRS